MPVISVVVPISSVNYVPRLRACINSVREQDYPQDEIEILITLLTNKAAEAADRVHLLNFCAEHGARLIEHVHDKQAWPPSLSRNVGYRKARGEFLVSLDADGVLDTQTFRYAEGWMKQNRCAVRVRTSLVPLKPGDPVFFRLDRDHFRRSVDLGSRAPGPGSCILAPREAVEKIRGWDEKFVGYGPADWDFVERLEKAGYPVINLSDTNDIWTLHQDHERILGTPLQHNNRAYHAQSKKKGNPVRNAKGWGGAS